MVDRREGRTTHITAQTKFVLALLITVLTLLAGCFPWLNGEYEFQLGDTVKVSNPGTESLRVRSAPAGTVTTVVPENWVFQISNATPVSAPLNGVSYLWWYVTDAQYESSPRSGWVAEQYLTKVLPSSLSPNTVPAYFTASVGQINSVIEQALQEVEDESEWYDYQNNIWLCLGFVRAVYEGESLGWISAQAAMEALAGRGLFHSVSGGWNPPKGALIFFESNLHPEYNHVGLSLGSRQVAHVEGDRKAHVRDLEYVVQLSYIDAYAGWAYPPEEWCQEPPLSEIAFESNRDGNPEIYVMNADGSNQRRLTYNPAEDNYQDWSPDGKKIAFTSNRDGNSEIYVMNTDGSNQRRLTYNSAFDYRPRWSPDGTKTAFERSHNDGITYDICVINADGSNERNLTNRPTTSDFFPRWSPDGSKIFFNSNRDENSEIYVMDADGVNQHNLTNNPAVDWGPMVSPDGTKIAFASRRGGNYEPNCDIYVMNANGSNVRRLTNTPENESLSWWAPSNKITFRIYRNGKSEIYTINADGSNKRLLTNSASPYTWITWSPDGSKIAFTSDRDGNPEIYVMNADGTNQHRLTNSLATDGSPVWSPIQP